MSEENKKLLVDRYYKSHYFTLLNSIVEKARRADLRLLKLNGEQMDVIVFPRRRWPRMGVVIGIRDRFSFPTGRSGFRQKTALIIFPEAMRHLPTAATTASGPSALSEGRVAWFVFTTSLTCFLSSRRGLPECDFRLTEDHPANPVA